MDRVLLAFILSLCTTSSLTISLPDGAEVKCPSRYRVQAMSDKSVELQVVDNKTECKRLLREKYTKRTNKKDVRPLVTTIYKDGSYKANISWEFMQRKKLPKLFLINLTFYHEETDMYISDTCVLLRITGNRKIKSKGLVKFYFDCLPLLDTPKIGLDVQLWGYSRTGRPCRSLRSLPQNGGPCGPDVRCSGERRFSISKDAHPYELCACYIKHRDIPKLNWQYDYSQQKFHINFTNVPPYLQSATIEIVEKQSDDRLVEDIEVRQDKIHDGEIHVDSKQFDIGNYTVYVCAKLKLFLQCEEPGYYDKQRISDHCDADNNYFAYTSQTLTVRRIKSEQVPSQEQTLWGDIKLQVILGVIGGLLITAGVTGVTFYFCHKRKVDGNRSDIVSSVNGMEMQVLSGMEGSETVEQDTLITRPNTENNLPPTFLETQQRTNNVEGNLTANENIHDLMDETGHLLEEYRPKPSANENGNHVANVTLTRKKYQIMLIYIPDAENPQLVQKVVELDQRLTNDFGIIIETPTAGNLYDFAESAFDKYLNVVMIMSKELATVCRQFRTADERSVQLHCNKNRAILPCIVLNKMENLIQFPTSIQHGTKPLLNIVCLDESRETKQALEDFLEDHQFLDTNNTRLHTICKSDLISEELSPGLKTLLNNFKPSVRHDIPAAIKLQIMQLNNDTDSLNSELEQ
ncbi:uncharacterized protein LOC132733456 isoform X2 [Ruditapes philippinarum]|nr:uncharacterized protein LOC132733456 isoform X2 [Ruditapes philippinarum]